MAQHETYFTCDLGGERYEKRENVRNDVTIVNGEHGRVFGDVCDKHAAELSKLIDMKFPNNSKISQGK